jgi:hypothetical protein
MASVIVLDASVLIAYLDRDDDHHAAAETLLARAIDDDLGVKSADPGEGTGRARSGRSLATGAGGSSRP